MSNNEMDVPQVVGLFALIGSALLTAIAVSYIRKSTLRHNIVDVPNERSSHQLPTPRGGGLGIVVVVVIFTLVLALTALIPWSMAAAILMGGAIALIGFLDDLGGLSPATRIVVHFACAAIGLGLIGGMPPLDLGFIVVNWGWLGQLAGVIGIVWMTNLYNFMDGIDGLAGVEAVTVFGAATAFLVMAGAPALALLCVLYTGANLGFLRWNWPPAKIFMGDVGSGFLGYSLAVLAIASSHQGVSLWCWLILAAVFGVDATVTLIRRMARGERWYSPHRSHAYQHLAQRWQSHRKVTLCVLGINLVWLTPLAAFVLLYPPWTLIFVACAVVPLVYLAIRLGAGQTKVPVASQS